MRKTGIGKSLGIVIGHEQQALIDEFTSFLRARGKKSNTIQRHIYCLHKFIQKAGADFNFKTAERNDLTRIISRVEEDKELAPETKRKIKIGIKLFYKVILGDCEFYPKQVSWIKAKISHEKKLMPEDLISTDEAKALIEHADNARDKAIIALLWDSGVRVGELLSMNFKDYEPPKTEKDIAHIRVVGKTGFRRVPVAFCVPYMSMWLNSRDLPQNHDTPLWLCSGTWGHRKEAIGRAAVVKAIRISARKAGITKRLYPHLFRHSAVTRRANDMSDQQLKSYYGWTRNSGMLATYSHLNTSDLDRAYAKSEGQEVPEEKQKPILRNKACDKCGRQNTLDAVYCVFCGLLLSKGTIMRMEEEKAEIKQLILELTKNPKMKDELLKMLILEMQKK